MADISAAFVTHYEVEVHTAYQQGGSRLRNTVRISEKVVGSSAKFTRIGKGEATQKPRHGNIIAMDVEHSQVSATLEDWYAPDYIDILDENKIKTDERKAIIQSGAYAVGRKVDSLIIAAALNGLPAAQAVTAGGVLDLETVLEAFALLNIGDVPDDGRRYAVVGPYQWNQLLKIDQFAKADYVGADAPIWLKGTEAKRWLNIMWMMHTALPGANAPAEQTDCLLYHQTALGLAEAGSGIHTEINYVPEKVAHLCNNMISCGAVRIDDLGVVQLTAQNA